MHGDEPDKAGDHGRDARATKATEWRAKLVEWRAKLAEWRAKLAEWQATTQPATLPAARVDPRPPDPAKTQPAAPDRDTQGSTHD